MAYILYWTTDTLYYVTTNEYDVEELNRMCGRIGMGPGVLGAVLYYGVDANLPPFAVCADSEKQA